MGVEKPVIEEDSVGVGGELVWTMLILFGDLGGGSMEMGGRIMGIIGYSVVLSCGTTFSSATSVFLSSGAWPSSVTDRWVT